MHTLRIENFWKEIFREKVQHNEEAYGIKTQSQRNHSMEWSPISKTEVAEVLRTTLNRRSPGRYQTVNFWLKQLTATHTYLATLCNRPIEEGHIPDWLMIGVTILISKNENTE